MSLLDDESYKDCRRMLCHRLLFLKKRPSSLSYQATNELEKIIAVGVAKIRASMTLQEQSDLNAGYLAYRRITKGELPNAVRFNLVPAAIRWRVINEFASETTDDSKAEA